MLDASRNSFEVGCVMLRQMSGEDVPGGMKLSRGISITLIVIAVVLVVFGFTEHLFFRVTIVPHLAVILGVIAVVLAGVGIYGLTSGPKASSGRM
jgi:hypothetical protein